MQRITFVVAIMSALASLPRGAEAAPPDAKKKPGDAPIELYLAREAKQLATRFLDGADSKEGWEARRPRLRQEFLEMLGLWPLPKRTPLREKVTGTLEREGVVVIENLHFQSRPGLYVTGNLYRPKEPKGRLPAVLYVCGHTGKGRDGNKTAFQDHGMWFARNGYVCLVIDTLQLGELPGIHHGTYRYDRWWWQAVGYTPAGVECWNGIRAIDYLVGRTDVDPERVAVTGISGGGATTFWVAAADERVRCAVPVSGMSDLESYVANKVVNGHCDCMFVVNTHGWEWTTIAALIAPRPLLFANSDQDTIFPMDGNNRIMSRLRRLYDWYGKPELLTDHVSHGGHDYRPDLRMAVFSWINKHLKNDANPVKDATDPPIDGKRLRVFPEDTDLPADALNGKIDESFVARSEVELPGSAAGFPAWKNRLLEALRKGPLRGLARRRMAAELPPGAGGDRRVRRLMTESGIEVEILDLRGEKRGGDRHTLIVLNPGEELTSVPRALVPYVESGEAVLLAPRGVGATEWSQGSPPNYVARAHALLGRTVDEGRVHDIAAVVGWLGLESPGLTRWRVAGARQAGVLASYAALFEPSIKEVLAVDPPASHRDGPIFLGILKILDVPVALGMLAPTPLTLINSRGFDQTASIYERAGAASVFKRVSR